MVDVTWLGEAPPDDEERKSRRTGAALVVVALTVLAAIGAAVVLFTARDEQPAVQAHRGEQRATFESADGKLEAAIYRIDGLTEVVLRRPGATADRDMVSFGCTREEDGLFIAAVTVRAGSLVTRNGNGDEREFLFDEKTLRPETTLGRC
ncbi:hypothetical protein ACQP00_18535 [Dactylosporangium sp. CS-047395]|uniref:hypothetical protein n=1 Tax=Dactylosporangium sp. CS-047395 TaxID=3239936 RepID=UPI003D8C2372